MNYDYREVLKHDIKDYINYYINYKDYNTLDQLSEYLNNNVPTSYVTGKDSGSYTHSSYEAEEYLSHNLDLLVEACRAYGQDVGEVLSKGSGNADVIIRCYLLKEVIPNVMNEIKNDFIYAHTDIYDKDNEYEEEILE